MPALPRIKAAPGNHAVQSTSHFCEKLDVFQAQTVWANPTPDLIILGLLFKGLRAAVSFSKNTYLQYSQCPCETQPLLSLLSCSFMECAEDFIIMCCNVMYVQYIRLKGSNKAFVSRG